MCAGDQGLCVQRLCNVGDFMVLARGMEVFCGFVNLLPLLSWNAPWKFVVVYLFLSFGAGLKSR